MDDRELAEESVKTQKVREKLKRHLEKIDEQVTQQELSRKISDIHRWISRHALHRVNIKVKSFSLFDENQNAARMSQKISLFMQQIQKELQQTADPDKS